jgi:hypothetical protein
MSSDHFIENHSIRKRVPPIWLIVAVPAVTAAASAPSMVAPAEALTVRAQRRSRKAL